MEGQQQHFHVDGLESQGSHVEDSPSPSLALYRIASYLSLGDAKGSIASPSRPSPLAAGLHSTSSSIQLPIRGHRSLDDMFYHSMRMTAPSGLSTGKLQPHSADHAQPLPFVVDSLHERNKDEEDWFVGGGQNAEFSYSMVDCGRLLPQEEALSPLDEEYHGPRREGLLTPAGQATGENEAESQGVACDVQRDRSEKQGQSIACEVRREWSEGQSDKSDADHKRENNSLLFIRRKRRRTKQVLLKNKLAAAVFVHPHPLRHYCLDAYATARNLSMERQKQSASSRTHESPQNLRGGVGSQVAHRKGNDMRCHQKRHSDQSGRDGVIGTIEITPQHNVLLSVTMDFTESACSLSVETLIAVGRIGAITTDRCVSMICDAGCFAADIASRVNPLSVFELVVNAQRSAMGKTGDVLASGIQSVATGVGSVSNAALNRLSSQGLALAGGVVGGGKPSPLRTGWGAGNGGFRQMRKDSFVGESVLGSKLLHRLNCMENMSQLVAYSERAGEEAFSKYAKKRAQRMMHYHVSFQPFTATIQPSNPQNFGRLKRSVSFDFKPSDTESRNEDGDNDSISSESLNSSGSMFMRTPTSFPPTPTSRLYYFERGSRFTENVVFLARDQLRVERGMCACNEQTRAMSRAQIDGSRLAVFDAVDAGVGIALSCGQHIATKVGNALYSSVRSMIPVMRNSYIYFEISVSPSLTEKERSLIAPRTDAALSVGVSTVEMPLDSLVGAWVSSVGFCSTGQVLHAGEWFSPTNTEESSYGSNSTVGCLVYLDDNSGDESNVTADVMFSINGRVAHSSVFGGTTSNQNHPDTSKLSLLVPRAHELFPTVTLHSPGACVMCRFSAEDLLAHTRAEIGAQRGVVVYAVDGTVILEESDEDEFIDGSFSWNDFSQKEVAL